MASTRGRERMFYQRMEEARLKNNSVRILTDYIRWKNPELSRITIKINQYSRACNTNITKVPHIKQGSLGLELIIRAQRSGVLLLEYTKAKQ